MDEYLSLSEELLLDTLYAKHFDAIRKGLSRVIPLEYLDQVSETELFNGLVGTSTIDIEDWKTSTAYEGMPANDPLVGYFWQIVREFNEEQRFKLLEFVTAQRRLPGGKLSNLRSNNDTGKQFVLKKLVHCSPNKLPYAHTCFNTLDLPPYRSKKQMKEKLLLAIYETRGFLIG